MTPQQVEAAKKHQNVVNIYDCIYRAYQALTEAIEMVHENEITLHDYMYDVNVLASGDECIIDDYIRYAEYMNRVSGRLESACNALYDKTGMIGEDYPVANQLVANILGDANNDE